MRRKVSEKYGCKSKKVVRELLKRKRWKERKLAASITSRAKGRPGKGATPKDLIAEQAYKITRLKIEHKLLRGYLQFTGRKWRPHIKYQFIYRNWYRYAISSICRSFSVSHSGYYGFVRRIGKGERGTEQIWFGSDRKNVIKPIVTVRYGSGRWAAKTITMPRQSCESWRSTNLCKNLPSPTKVTAEQASARIVSRTVSKTLILSEAGMVQ